ncbi:MAG TPA: hypothetical protein ENJ40_00085 [Thermosulfurimonas dismutans]|uniref:Uncharacterized protein n=1 Tax=Thermosulfurimonas dismutans TaxID=999894 RepID=A0A7C3GRE7_9BACT|nr:hypothetical protein [Thermosulfurimonas dismutans]
MKNDLGGRLKNYVKTTIISYEQQREIAWQKVAYEWEIRFKRLQKQIKPLTQKAGLVTEEDVFEKLLTETRKAVQKAGMTPKDVEDAIQKVRRDFGKL